MLLLVYDAVEEDLHDYIEQVRADGVTLTRSVLQRKALVSFSIDVKCDLGVAEQ